MRHTILSIGPNQCKFAVTPHDATEHLFCGEVTPDDKPYCTHHQKICSNGYGQNIKSLEEMIYGRESTIVRDSNRPHRGAATVAVDVEVARRLKK